MEKFAKIFLIIVIVFVAFVVLIIATAPENSQTIQANKQNGEPKWLLKEWEYGEKYPYTLDDLTINCKASAVWLEDVNGNKYALNGFAKSMLKNDKKYKGTTDAILKKGMADLYLPNDALKICLPVN